MGILFLLSLGASAIISILRGFFSLPVARLATVGIGSRLAAFLLIWIYYSAFIIVLGAEFTYQYSSMRRSAGAANIAEK